MDGLMARTLKKSILKDSSMAPIDMLPEILAAAGKRLTVMVDSGFRRGADVVKALALGASAVVIGRAPF